MSAPAFDLPQLMLAESAALVLAVARVAGFVMTSPFPGKSADTKIKVGLILMIAFLARSASAPTTAFALDMKLIGFVPGELGIGLLIGFTVRVTFAAAEILGAQFAQATGLTMGQVYDPSLGTEDPVPARVITLLSMLVFLGLGAHRVALAYVLESFRAIPIGQAVEINAAAPSFVAFLDQAMDAGVRLSLPIMAISLAVQVSLALVARASPSLQVFSVGMGVSIAAGLLTLMGSLGDITSGLGVEMQKTAPRVEQVLGDVQSPTPPRAPNRLPGGP